MAQQGDYPRGREPGYTKAAGFGQNGQNPRTRPPATPEQWQQGIPPRQDPHPTPQSPHRQVQQPAFTPDLWRDSQKPGGQYPPPQPEWQPQQPTWQQQYAPRAPRQRRRHTVRNVIAGIGALIAVIIVAENKQPEEKEKQRYSALVGRFARASIGPAHCTRSQRPPGRSSRPVAASQRPRRPGPQRVRSRTASCRDQPTPANDNQRCVLAGQGTFQRSDVGGHFRPHEFELYFDV
jgi:hypothetical protein